MMASWCNYGHNAYIQCADTLPQPATATATAPGALARGVAQVRCAAYCGFLLFINCTWAGAWVAEGGGAAARDISAASV